MRDRETATFIVSWQDILLQIINVCYSKRLGNIFFRLYSHGNHSNFFVQFCPREKGATRLTLCEAPTRETRPDHDTGNYVPYIFRQVYTFFFSFFL